MVLLNRKLCRSLLLLCSISLLLPANTRQTLTNANSATESESESMKNIIDSYPEDFDESGNPNPFFKHRDLNHKISLQKSAKGNVSRSEHTNGIKSHSPSISAKIKNLRIKLDQMLKLENAKKTLDLENESHNEKLSSDFELFKKSQKKNELGKNVSFLDANLHSKKSAQIPDQGQLYHEMLKTYNDNEQALLDHSRDTRQMVNQAKGIHRQMFLASQQSSQLPSNSQKISFLENIVVMIQMNCLVSKV